MKFLNLSYLNEVANGDNDFIKTVLALLLSKTLPEIKTLKTLAASQKWGEVRAVAHRAKGSLSMVSQDATEQAKRIENMASKREALHKIADEIIAFETFVAEKLVPEIKVYLA